MAVIDLNCDLGEGAGHDAELLKLVTSANIACGAHAGDPMTMVLTMSEARDCGVRIGAHPGYFDREHFGRRELQLTHDEMFSGCVYQVAAIIALANTVNTSVSYIKPHGAFYNQACRETWPAAAVISAAQYFGLPVLALPNSKIEESCGAYVRFIREGFADRRYRPDGTLVPRTESGAFVEDPTEAVAQAERLIEEQGIRSLCVHGDSPQALTFVVSLREELVKRGHRIEPFA